MKWSWELGSPRRGTKGKDSLEPEQPEEAEGPRDKLGTERLSHKQKRGKVVALPVPELIFEYLDYEVMGKIGVI